MCKVSVIVPVYNGELFLKNTLHSIQSQTLWDIEILCIDDGSTDRTAQLIRKEQKTDRRIRYQYQKNGGAGSARNRGIRAARGEFLAFMDADDSYPDGSVLEKLYMVAKEKNVVICGGSVQREGADASWNKKNSVSEEGYYTVEKEVPDLLFWRFLFQRAFLEKEGLLFPERRVYEDPVFLVKAMLAAQKFYLIKDPVYDYSGPHQIHSMDSEKIKDYLAGITQELKLSSQYQLEELHRKVWKRLEKEASYYAEPYLYRDDPEIFRLLMQADAAIDRKLLAIEEDYMLPALYILWKNGKKLYRFRNQKWICGILYVFRRWSKKQKEKGKKNVAGMDNGHTTKI